MSRVVDMDRWKLTVYDDSAGGVPVKEMVMNNYFSLGIDAAIALKFHQQREQAPEKFASRAGNKFRYALLGAEKALLPGCMLYDNVQITAGVASPVPVPVQGDWEGVVVSNLPNYQAGQNFWGAPSSTEPFYPINICDGLLEVMGLSGGMHMAVIRTELYTANRLAQTDRLQLRVSHDVPMQVDGEPWMQTGPCTIVIESWNHAPMLKKCGYIPPAFDVETETETDTDTEHLPSKACPP
eukprot:NODE_1309_length_1013_cov_58.443983_g1009_i0.p2 GENE.NODE_1309_length_1013_cov_58.443983_g1009_i0~~NODE_1309_length_1013_cov_58.443983_g1009_i0.p2  ORF type:complete len:239 (+),score=55.46 NODE_1309_length_1013_cov_58.443983_g1009_i0:196-912(+)